MKILLLEYITAGGLNHEPLPEALLQQGILMRDALLRDFSDIEEIKVITTYDYRLNAPPIAIEAICISQRCDANVVWQNLLQTCDMALIVAPETYGILTQLTHMIEVAGNINLGSSCHAVQIASNKYQTFNLLSNANILTIPTYTASEFLGEDNPAPLFSNGWVAKPIDGAGCENTFYFPQQNALESWLKQTTFELKAYIIQPYLLGVPASISMLCKNGKACVLSCNKQMIETIDNENPINPALIQYTGCVVNGLSQYHNHFTELANKIAAAMPGLNGYVGIDVIIEERNEEARLWVVEINPRITTSYTALRDLSDCNPAQLILDLAHKNLPSPSLIGPFNFQQNRTNNMGEIIVHGK